MSELSRDDVLKANDCVVEKVEVPGWKGYVYVKMMTGEERARFFEGTKKDEPDGQTWARQCVCSVVDKDGKPLFTDADIPELVKKNGAVLQRLSMISSRINGLTESALREMVKNSGSGQSGDFISDSAANSEE